MGSRRYAGNVGSLEWVVFGLLSAAVLVIGAIAALRATRRGRRFLALGMRDKVRFGRLLIADGGVPLPARAILVVLVGYLAMPFDLIPDFVPVLGQLDDAIVVSLAVFLLLVLIPRERFDAALRQVETEADERRSAAARQTGIET